jgi:PIN domain nuclease of toxin-antitoxin system
MVNLDTHILLHAVTGQLRPAEEAVLDATSWCISAIVLWEIEKLAILGRISINLDASPMQPILDRTTLLPISRAVCSQMRRLDFRSDPADELIAATTLAHGVPLVTRDRRLRSSNLIPLAT